MEPLFRRRKPPARPPLARRVQELEIITARLIRLGFAGDYHSAFLGHGIEFAQVREYQPGDDIRTIDWNVTARSGTPHVKQFIEERDVAVIVAVDCSASMLFGSIDKTKLDIASELTAVLAFSAVQNSDRIGLLLFSDSVRDFVPPRRGRKHAQTLVRSALSAAEKAGGPTDFRDAVRFIEGVAVKRAVVIVISDFLGSDFERPLRRLGWKHDVVAISVRDPRERALPRRGLVLLADNETGEQRLVDLATTRVSGADFDEQMLDERFRRSGIDLLRLSTVAPYDQSLLRFFKQRPVRR